jgi:pyruvate/2-oxoglutarate dehydrogenase complex dihydrolipoamide dehydrogenase (E3) component
MPCEDEHDRRWLDNARPSGRLNPTPSGPYNLVVVGAGPAGLVSAAAAAVLGAKVALVERGSMGGDCLNVGCVPSKALLRAARAVAAVRSASQFGVRFSGGVAVDVSFVLERMRRLRAEISESDSVERFARLGVDVFLGAATFTGPDRVEVDGRTLEFRRAIVATGTRPAVPEAPGLRDVGFLTNETFFSQSEWPRRWAVVGGGPIGCELAQALSRFGAAVVLIESGGRLLPRDDPEASRIVLASLRRDGVDVRLSTSLVEARRVGAVKVLLLEGEGGRIEIETDEILVAVGRLPNVEGLGLEAAGVAFDGEGVRVDGRLRTTNRNIFAAGDVCSKFKFTHAADAMARIAVRNALFPGWAGTGGLVVPWCTYTDPEVAHVGETPYASGPSRRPVQTFEVRLEEVDRAVLDDCRDGFVRIHAAARGGAILGATIVAPHAGEMISELTLAMRAGVGLGALASVIHPYPTLAEAVRRCGDQFQRRRLTPWVARACAAWLRWTRGR